jgi:hypothetical protein
MQKIEITMKKKIPTSKITTRTKLKREESSTDKRRICIPMKTTTLLMKVTMKQNKFSSWP